MPFSTYRDAVAAVMPEHSMDWFWLGVGQSIREREPGCVVVTTTSILGNRESGYSHDKTVHFFRPLREFSCLAEAEEALPTIAEALSVAPSALKVLATGVETPAINFEVTDTPHGLGHQLRSRS